VAPALGGVIIGYTVAEALDLPSVFTERKDGEMTLRAAFRLRPASRSSSSKDVVTTGKSTRERPKVVESTAGSWPGSRRSSTAATGRIRSTRRMLR